MLQKQHSKLRHYSKCSHVILSMTPNLIACKHAPNHILGSMTQRYILSVIYMYIIEICFRESFSKRAKLHHFSFFSMENGPEYT